MESPDIFLPWVKLSGQSEFGRHHDTSQQRLYEFCYFLSFDLWTFYFARILFLKDVAVCFGNILILQGSLMGYNIVF
jgi:hypothetical protein